MRCKSRKQSRMKPFTSPILLTYLVVCSLISSSLAVKGWFGWGTKPYPEDQLNDLEELVNELLKSSQTTDLLQLKGTIDNAKSLISKQPEKKKREDALQRQIDDALKKVSKFHDKLNSKTKEKLKKYGVDAVKVGAGVAIGLGLDWAFKSGENTVKPASKINNPPGAKIDLPSGGIFGNNKLGPPEADTNAFSWTWVVVGVLVIVTIGLALYLFQGNLFGSADDEYEDGYGENYEETDTKKTKRRKSKKRKRRNTA